MQVREVAIEAVARARAGLGPTLIECETYRFRGHSLADPDELRRKEEKEHYAVKPPPPPPPRPRGAHLLPFLMCTYSCLFQF